MTVATHRQNGRSEAQALVDGKPRLPWHTSDKRLLAVLSSRSSKSTEIHRRDRVAVDVDALGVILTYVCRGR